MRFWLNSKFNAKSPKNFSMLKLSAHAILFGNFSKLEFTEYLTKFGQIKHLE